MKNSIKSFLNALYLSILLFFVSLFSCRFWLHFLIPIREEFDVYAKYFYIILSALPFVILGVKTLYFFPRKRKENPITSGKTFKIFNLLFLFPIIFFFIPLILMSKQASHTHMWLAIDMIFSIYAMPFYWIFILYTLKKTYGIKWGWGGLLIALVSFYLFFNLSVRCPTDRPLKDYSGMCHSCDEKRPIGIVNQCSICPNRVEISNGLLCGIIANCPADKPLKGENGECYSCDDLEGILVLDCSVCPNRTIIGRHCSLSTCPKDYPLQDFRRGSCYSCDEPNGIELLSENCSICPNRSLIGKNYRSGKNCSWTTCPENYPVRGSLGSCMSCEEALHYNYNTESKRKYQELCLKKDI